MNADENPYAPPNADDASTPRTDDHLEEKRRYRVAWMWGASGCGYLALPWWLRLEPVTVGLCVFMLLMSLIFAAIAFIAAVSVGLIGKPRDLVGAICGLIFGAGFIGVSAIQMFNAVVTEYLANP